MSVLFSVLASVAFAQSVAVSGSCPGGATVDITGITRGGTVAILKGSGPGSDVMPAGPCAGGRTGLAGLSFITTVTDSDGDGSIRLSPSLPAGVCGQSIQVVDTSTCRLSGVAELPGGGGGLEYRESFMTGVTPTAQCTEWRSYIAALPSSGLTEVTMSGSAGAPITCSDPAVAQGIANAIRTNATFDMMCDGNRWTNCNRYEGEVWINPPDLCSGANCPNPGYIIRPCIGNPNWGGVGTATCGGINQEMALSFR